MAWCRTVRPTASGHGATGEFIDDDDFAAAHDVFDVPMKQGVRAQTGIHVVEDPRLAASYKLSPPCSSPLQ